MLARLATARVATSLAASSTRRASLVFFSTNAAEVIDDAANRQELEQISKQMEDALTKEKEILDSPQTPADSTMWDASLEMPQDPAEAGIPKTSNAELMEKIRDEQNLMGGAREAVPGSSFAKQEASSLGMTPEGFQKREDYTGKSQDSFSSPSSSKSGEDEKRFRGGGGDHDHQDRRSPQRAAPPFPMGFPTIGDNPISVAMDTAMGVVNGTGQLLKGTAKVAIRGVRDIADEVLKATGGNESETSKESDRDVNKRPGMADDDQDFDQRNRNRGGYQGGDSNNDRDSRGKEYSENRENASLL